MRPSGPVRRAHLGSALLGLSPEPRCPARACLLRPPSGQAASGLEGRGHGLLANEMQDKIRFPLENASDPA